MTCTICCCIVPACLERLGGLGPLPRRLEHVSVQHDAAAPTLAGVADLPPTISVEEAGRMVGIGRNAAYRAAAAGHIPAIRIGHKLRVPTARLLELLGIRAGEPGAAA